MRKLSLFICGMVVCAPAFAAPYTYSPENCEVSMVFPEKPYIESKCTGGDQKCTEIVTFTKTVPEKSASINFRVSCRNENVDELNKFTTTIMEETLKKMTSDAGIEPYNITSSEEDGFKKASSLSIGQKNDKTYIHSGQIWIGKNSIFTLEAEMIGEKDEALDKSFADILKNTKSKK